MRFTSGLAPLSDFARTHFGHGTQVTGNDRTIGSGDEPDGGAEIDAHLDWIEGIPPKTGDRMMSPGKAWPDRDIEISGNEMTWSRIDDFLPLRLRFWFEEDRLRLEGKHFFALSQAPMRDILRKTLHRRRLSTLRRKRFSTILYYMIYYPCFWWLERRGLLPLHAAAVDLEGTGAVFCGPPGCGKSTLSLALLSVPGIRLLSDNIVFFSAERVFRCPEPVLLDDQALRLTVAKDGVLHGLGRRHVYDRGWYHVDPRRVVEQTSPRLFFAVRLGKECGLREISMEETYRQFSAANWIAKELRRYFVYRSVLALASPNDYGQTNGDPSSLGMLLSQGRSYELTVGLGNELHKTCGQVASLLKSLQ